MLTRYKDFKVLLESQQHHNFPSKWYHGSNSQFDSFRPDKMGANFPMSTLGIYFTSKLAPPPYGSTAQEYAEEAVRQHGGEPYIYEVSLTFSKPLVLDANGWYNSVACIDKQRSDIKRWMEDADYDIIICYDFKEKYDTYREYVAVVQNPNQIKIEKVTPLVEVEA